MDELFDLVYDSGMKFFALIFICMGIGLAIQGNIIGIGLCLGLLMGLLKNDQS